MPYPTFDLSRVRPESWSQFVPKTKSIPPLNVDADNHTPTVQSLGEELVKARNQGAATVFLCDADAITVETSRTLAQLVSRGLVTHVGLEASAAGKDWQIAWSNECGVKAGLSNGTSPPLWSEELVRHAREDRTDDFSLGEYAGKSLIESDAEFKNASLLAEAYRWGTPVTIHNDYLPEPPSQFERLSEDVDFLVMANSIENLDQGLVYQFGVPTLPLEAFLVGLNLSQAVAAQFGRTIDEFTATTFIESDASSTFNGVHLIESAERSFIVQGAIEGTMRELYQAAMRFAGWSDEEILAT